MAFNKSNDKDRSDATNGTNFLDDDIYDSTVSDVDQRILELLESGLSYKQISQQLHREGISLSKTGVGRHIKELRQDPDNNVHTRRPCYRKPREQTREYRIIELFKQNMDEYEELYGVKPSFRTMAYQLQDLGKLKPKQVPWLNNLTVQARLGWVGSDGKPLFPYLDINCFPEDDSRETLGDRDDMQGFHGSPARDPEDPNEYIDQYIEDLKNAPNNYDGIGSRGTSDSPGGRWWRQPEVVEIWEEKNDLLKSFHKLIGDRGIKIRANKGWSSLEFLYRCMLELKPLAQQYGREHIHILYCGDWDPSGSKMEDYIRRRLKQLGLEGIDIRRIAVTPDQIDEYHLPLMDLDSEGNGDKNSNKKEFIRKYGRKATHLNAFFTKKHIKDFQKILIAEIDKHWDKQIYEDMLEEYSGEAEPAPRCSAEELNYRRSNMFNKITAAFYDGWSLEYYYDEEDSDDEEEE